MTTRFREGGREYLIPYLGESWTYVPNQRIELIAEGPLRKAKIVKCPKGNSGAAFYRVNVIVKKHSNLLIDISSRKGKCSWSKRLNTLNVTYCHLCIKLSRT